MNRFTQQKPISKSVLSILVPVVVFFAGVFFAATFFAAAFFALSFFTATFLVVFFAVSGFGFGSGEECYL